MFLPPNFELFSKRIGKNSVKKHELFHGIFRQFPKQQNFQQKRNFFATYTAEKQLSNPFIIAFHQTPNSPEKFS
jgi:hypothetical protein